MNWSQLLVIFEQLPSELKLLVGLVEAVQAVKNGAHESAQIHIDNTKEYILNHPIVHELDSNLKHPPDENNVG